MHDAHTVSLNRWQPITDSNAVHADTFMIYPCWLRRDGGSSCRRPRLHGAVDGLDLRLAAGTLGAYVLAVVVEGDGLLVQRRRLRADELARRSDGEVGVRVAEEGDGEAFLVGVGQRTVLHAPVTPVAQDLEDHTKVNLEASESSSFSSEALLSLSFNFSLHACTHVIIFLTYLDCMAYYCVCNCHLLVRICWSCNLLVRICWSCFPTNWT